MTGLPIIVLPTVAVLGLNIALWASAQILAGYAAHRLPLDRLDHDGRLLRLRPFEDGGRWYRRRLHIDRWKDRLPEAGAFFAGGVTKRTLPDRHAGGVERFAAETRRAELAHWASFAGLPLCVIWNDVLGVVLMVTYGLVVNLPLIAIQRYNRGRTQRILAARARRADVAPHA